MDNKTFEPKDKLTKKRALELFYSSNKSTIVLWDNEKDCLVGYFSPYLVTHKYASDYIISNQTYQQVLQNLQVFHFDFGGGLPVKYSLTYTLLHCNTTIYIKNPRNELVVFLT